VDARDISAFTRVFDALCAGMTVQVAAHVATNTDLAME